MKLQNYELESGHSLGVRGNLKNKLAFWRSIGALVFNLSMIENVYKLPFVPFPLPVKLRSNTSARLHVDFVDQAVLELMLTLVACVWVVNPLSVSIQPRGKKRLILDLSDVNNSYMFNFHCAPALSFLCPLCFHKGFKAFRKVFENTGCLYSHLLGR